jgi:hypothetical protein
MDVLQLLDAYVTTVVFDFQDPTGVAAGWTARVQPGGRNSLRPSGLRGRRLNPELIVPEAFRPLAETLMLEMAQDRRGVRRCTRLMR